MMTSTTTGTGSSESKPMAKFLLRGAITFRVNAGSPAKIEFDLTPAEGFLTPKSIGYKRAIAFPEDEPIRSAKLIPLTNDSIVRCTADDSIKDVLVPLLSCAAQNRPVTLYLELGDPQKVVGFQCP